MIPTGSPKCHKIVWGQAYVVDIIGSLHIRIEMIVKILMIRTRPHVLSNMFRRPHHELLYLQSECAPKSKVLVSV